MFIGYTDVNLTVCYTHGGNIFLRLPERNTFVDIKMPFGKTEDYVEIYLNMHDKEVTFALNGASVPKATIRNLPAISFCVAASLRFFEDCLTLVESRPYQQSELDSLKHFTP